MQIHYVAPCCALILFTQTLALYKSFTYLLTLHFVYHIKFRCTRGLVILPNAFSFQAASKLLLLSSCPLTTAPSTSVSDNHAHCVRFYYPHHLWCQSFCSCRSRDGTVYRQVTVQSVSAITKDIFVWIVGPRRTANYFNCAV